VSAIEFVEPEDLAKKAGALPQVVDQNELPETEPAGQSEEDRVDDDRLEFTQNVREQIVTGLMPTGKAPTDLKEIDRLLATLDGIDRAVHTKRRTKQADKQVQNDTMIAKILEKAQLELERKQLTGSNSAPTRAANALDPSFLSQPVTLEGEFKEQVEQETSADFFERMENDHPELRRGEKEE
jgi:hypothetical protein